MWQLWQTGSIGGLTPQNKSLRMKNILIQRIKVGNGLVNLPF
jgi:hypothetical protein